MLTIKVLGAGCSRCDELHALAQQAIDSSGVSARLTKVESLDAIMAHGVMLVPALLIDEAVVSSGKLPKPKQIVAWLTAAAAG